jgi:hypothetical protein
MRLARLLMVAIALAMLGWTSMATAGSYYVVKDNVGRAAVVDYQPGPGWTVVDGPFEYRDTAARAAHLGTSPATGSRPLPSPRMAGSL